MYEPNKLTAFDLAATATTTAGLLRHHALKFKTSLKPPLEFAAIVVVAILDAAVYCYSLVTVMVPHTLLLQ